MPKNKKKYILRPPSDNFYFVFAFFSIFLFSSSLVFAKAPKYPIILVHGASMGGAYLKIGPINFGAYFQRLPGYLESLGATVGVPHLTTDTSIGERALVLNHFLKTKFRGKKVNLVGHSLGGLDSRYVASILENKQVVSVTTIATPHQGTPLADWAYDQSQNQKFWYKFMRFFGYDLRGRKFLRELTTESMNKNFNPRVPDRSDVKYFSILAWGEVGDFSLSPMLYPTNYFLRQEKHPSSKEKNDGLVPLSSQKWGKVIAEKKLDHLAQMNHHSFRFSHEDKSKALYKLIVDNLVASGL